MPRTALQIAQDASYKLGIAPPDILFASTERTYQEVRSTLNEVAERLMRAHDWAMLKTRHTHSGDGTTASFALPSDYVRMLKEGQIWSTRWQRPLQHIDTETALNLDIRNYDLVVGTWTRLGENIEYAPALASGEDARFYYVSENVVKPATGSNKPLFTADDDTFLLGDRLLELHLIWEHRQKKGLDYAEDLQTAEIALAQAISDDAGARIITQSRRRNTRARVAYPWQITPT